MTTGKRKPRRDEPGARRHRPGAGRPATPDSAGRVNLRSLQVDLEVAERVRGLAAELGLTMAEVHRRALVAGLPALERAAAQVAREGEA